MRDRMKTLLSMPSIRYTASSLLAFGIEYVLALFLNYLFFRTAGMSERLSYNAAMAIAWVISSNVNFCVNRTVVFHSKDPALPAYVKYFALALPVFLIKSLGLVNLLIGLTRLPLWIAMPVAQTAMFVITYIVQKKLIFKMKKKESGDTDETNN